MPDKKSRPTVYDTWFLSLTLRNVRCFAEEQTLDLRTAAGRPARWTLILGDNGTGKTCLLQCLAALAPTRWRQSGSGVTSARAEALPLFARRAASQAAFDATVCLAASINSEAVARGNFFDYVERGAMAGDSYGLTVDAAFATGEARQHWDAAHLRGMNCFAYGPYRRWGRTRLAAPTQAPDETLFDPDAVLQGCGSSAVARHDLVA